MSQRRRVVLLPLVAGLLFGLGACAPGAPRRPAAVNPYGISDDISAVTMTQSEVLRAADPNLRSTYPKGFETHGH